MQRNPPNSLLLRDWGFHGSSELNDIIGNLSDYSSVGFLPGKWSSPVSKVRERKFIIVHCQILSATMLFGSVADLYLIFCHWDSTQDGILVVWKI